MSYTTKPIELPLRKDKEYILVDIEGYVASSHSNIQFKGKHSLTQPFKLDLVTNLLGCINGDGIILTEYDEHEYFHEVIRQPQTSEFNTDSIAVTEQEEEAFNAMSEVEWSNGDDAIFNHNSVIFIGKHPSSKRSDLVVVDSVDGLLIVNINSLSKPETPEQREERERLEAAKDLAQLYWGVRTDAEPSPELLKAMLRIVDKTNYRK